MIIKKKILIVLFIFLSTVLVGQNIKLDKSKRIDTLTIWLDISNKIDAKMQEELEVIFQNQISNFNIGNNSFIIKIDSNGLTNSIRMNMDSIYYVDAKRSLKVTGLDLLLIAGHVVMVSSFGWTVPVFFLPGTACRIDLEIDPSLVKSKSKTKMFVSPNGYFKKKEMQKQKFKIKFESKIKKLIFSIDRQNRKQKKKEP
ncbi:MAG: hypothetical protein PF517_15845 [Salinivirgaceae bacterium]|nr:hypothetical protein [Salinivirgaceae bacterium]